MYRVCGFVFECLAVRGVVKLGKDIIKRPRKGEVGDFNEFLLLDDASFVELLYELVLARSFDEGGRDYYLGLLKAGESRLSIINMMYSSDEAIGMRRGVSEAEKKSQQLRRGVSEALFKSKHPIRHLIARALKLSAYPQDDEPLARVVHSSSLPEHGYSGQFIGGKPFGLEHYEAGINDVFKKVDGLHSMFLEFEARLDGAEISDELENLGASDRRYLFNLSTSNLWRAHPVGIIRVEREIASYMKRFSNVCFVVWDPKSKSLRQLNKAQVDKILKPEWCSKDSSVPSYNPAALRKVPIQPGDTYISLGLDWDHAPSNQLANYLRPLGAKLILTCHDVVPVKFPEFLVREEIGQEFRQHLVEMAHAADKIWAVSKASKQALETFWQDAQVECRVPEVFSVPLASYACHSSLPQLNEHDHAVMRDVFPKGDYVLYVSSFEPRKNHKLMLDIWRELWSERGAECPQFVFVGMRGWGCNDLSQALPRMTAAVKGKITWLQGVSDDLLQHLYYNCAFTVFPSICEGWGLAASESLQFGKVCVVSSNSSLQEATQGLMPAFHPLDFPSWKAEIERLFDDLAYRHFLEEQIVAKYQPSTWRDVGERFCQNLLMEDRK